MTRVAPLLGLVAALQGGVAAPGPAAPATAGTAQVASDSVRDTRTAQVISDSVLDARTTAVASQLRCVVCQGVSIQDSPSELAQQMRALVRDQLAAGKSEAEVRDYFIARYGEWILLSPRPSGFNLLVYVLPALALIGGGVVIVMVARRWIAAPAGAEGETPTVAPNDE